MNVTAIEDKNKTALSVLPRLYVRTEAFDRAVDVLVKHAAEEGDKGAALYAEAGRIAFENLADPEVAQRHLEKALSLDNENLAALKVLGHLREARDADAAVEMLLRAEAASGSRTERIALLWDAAQLTDQRLEDPSRALELFERVLRLDPDHVDAGQRVADRLVSNRRWDDALPVLEMLARQAEGLDRLEKSRREAQLGKAYEALHRYEKAARHFRLAVESDPESLEAAIGLANVLMAEAKVHEGSEQAAEMWTEVEKRYRELLARHRNGMADGHVAEIWYRLGAASRALGEEKKAEASFRRALEKEPLHEPTLEAMVELGGARGEWRIVADVREAPADIALAGVDGTDFNARCRDRHLARAHQGRDQRNRRVPRRPQDRPPRACCSTSCSRRLPSSANGAVRSRRSINCRASKTRRSAAARASTTPRP